MAQFWEDQASTWRKKMETWKTKMSTRDGRANGDAASQPAKIMEVVTDLQVPVESMELYDEVDGPPIFDVYDEEEQIYNNVVPFSHIYGDGDVAVLGFVLCKNQALLIHQGATSSSKNSLMCPILKQLSHGFGYDVLRPKHMCPLFLLRRIQTTSMNY
ncbi:hypothetical protein DY000_02053007 [Brassica cretica]|uniref:Uncharacterized protein n=1 Tax=Brassica cretica TaxID=69181 RepID=A0ABQ7AD23_BRACR|nr:hypothetical protein DY000_02053007 [Brassica cretica]